MKPFALALSLLLAATARAADPAPAPEAKPAPAAPAKPAPRTAPPSKAAEKGGAKAAPAKGAAPKAGPAAAQKPAVAGPEGELTIPGRRRPTTFDHAKHAAVACGKCHDTEPPGKIAAAHRETAHRFCLPCHKAEQKGPFECGTCHARVRKGTTPGPAPGALVAPNPPAAGSGPAR